MFNQGVIKADDFVTKNQVLNIQETLAKNNLSVDDIEALAPKAVVTSLTE